MTAARKLMKSDEFLRWCETQEDSYELVDGVPVLKYWNGPKMMAGGTKRQGRVIRNVLRALERRLRGGPCEPFLGDHVAVRTAIGKERRPDVFVPSSQAASNFSATPLMQWRWPVGAGPSGKI